MKLYLSLLCTLLLSGCSMTRNEKYADYVNPVIGTDIQRHARGDKAPSEEKGQTMPAVGVPNGMTNWVPQTLEGEHKCNPPYYYYHDEIQGFRVSHWISGSCTQDYGSVTIMPVTGELKTNARERASQFSHDEETAKPYYYQVMLKDYLIHAELTGLSHTGIMRFSFQSDKDRYIIIEPNSDKQQGYLKIDTKSREVTGYNPAYRIYQGSGKSAGFSGYFVIRFEEDFDSFGTWKDNEITTGETEIKGNKNRVGAWIKLAPEKGNSIQVKVGTSFTSIENARKNLEAEIPGWNFDKVKKQSAANWEKALSQIAVKSSDEKKKTQFYTALYNTRMLPRTFSDVEGYYPGFSENYTIHQAKDFTYYCDFSMWDIYRAVLPLYSILSPSLTGDFSKSFIVKGQQGGWLPIFPLWNNYTAAMIGDHGIAMMGDAILKEVPGFDYEEAYRLMHKNAFEVNTDRKSYVEGKGRRGLESYLQYNYIPLEDNVWDAFHKREQVSRTLEYAYDDFVLAQVARKLGKTDDYRTLMKRAMNYKNVIDPETGYARGRYANGEWIEPFEFDKFVDYICEGTPYHYTWYVPHDVNGLMKHIGKERFRTRLDTFFEKDYYWHGNEPGHHIPYLFALAGEAWKTQKWVHNILNREYNPTPDGLSGNDDAGQMSAWLVFSMVGFYPVCPGMPYYVIGSPGFEESIITLENGKKFKVEAKGYTEENIYIQSATLNGQPYNKCYILHKDILKGGTLSFVMGNTPNKQWASGADAMPYVTTE